MNFPKMNINLNLKYYLNDSLIKNSIYLMLGSIINAGSGFIFWVIVAKYYPLKEVGIASALISSLNFIMLVSLFGLDNALIRYLPTNDRNKVLNTSITVTTFSAIIMGVIFILGIDTFSPKLIFLKSFKNTFIFLLIVASYSSVTITGISFVALRKSLYYLFQSCIFGIRILFLLFLTSLGSIGIFVSFGFSSLLTLFFTYLFLIHLKMRPKINVDRKFLYDSFTFSAGNYVSSLSMTAPIFVTPIIVLNMLGSEQSAYFYIVVSIINVLTLIPSTISMSLFVEGSNGEPLNKMVYKSLFTTFSILIPAVFGIFIFGNSLLMLINKEYAAGTDLLKIMSLSTFFISLNYIYYSIKRIQKDTRRLVLASGLNCFLLFTFSYIFILRFGLIGIGYAWIVSYLIGSLFIGWIIWRDRMNGSIAKIHF